MDNIFILLTQHKIKICGVLFSGILLFLMGYWLDWEMFDLPFHANIWGTVSDWAMVLVTGVTLYFLMRNLKSQLIIEKTTIKATAIANEKYRNEILPSFSMKYNRVTLDQGEEFITHKFVFDFWLNQNECKNLKVEVQPFLVLSSKVEMEIIPNSLEYLVKNSHRLIDLRLVTERKIFEEMGADLSFRMEFEDTIDNKYSQTILFCTDYTTSKIDILDPCRII